MEVILLNRVGKLGSLGDRVEVKDGYARNYLIPKKLAVRATKDNIAYFETRREDLEKEVLKELEEAQKRGASLQGIQLTIRARADENKLYGSLGSREIAEALCEKGHKVEKKEIHLPQGTIRETGEHTVNLQLHSDVVMAITVLVEAE